MRLKVLAVHCFLIFILLSCTPDIQPPEQTSLFVYRFDPPAFVEYTEDFQAVNEIPFSIPPGCALFDVFSPTVGPSLLVELSCPNGQTVLFLDTVSESFTQPVTDSDSHFLAWASEGRK
jgi:hypothetical protein